MTYTEQRIAGLIDRAAQYKRERDVALAHVTRLRALLATAAEITARFASEGQEPPGAPAEGE